MPGPFPQPTPPPQAQATPPPYTPPGVRIPIVIGLDGLTKVQTPQGPQAVPLPPLQPPAQTPTPQPQFNPLTGNYDAPAGYADYVSGRVAQPMFDPIADTLGALAGSKLLSTVAQGVAPTVAPAAERAVVAPVVEGAAAKIGKQLPIGSGAPPTKGFFTAMIDDAGKMHIGGPGEMHADLMDRVGIEHFKNGLINDTIQSGFADPMGQYLTKQEASAVAGQLGRSGRSIDVIKGASGAVGAAAPSQDDKPSYMRQLLGETVGRGVEGLGQLSDTPGQLLHALSAIPVQAMDLMTGASRPNPYGTYNPPEPAAAAARQAFGIPPASELPTLPQRIGAMGWQAFGPEMGVAAVGQAGKFARGLGEVGAVGSKPKGTINAGINPKGYSPALEGLGPLWRDNILDAVDDMHQPAATADQWRAHLKNYKGTQHEAEWIGLDNFFKENPKPTREELAEWVKGHQLGVEEVLRGPVQGSTNLWDEYERAVDDARATYGEDETKWPESVSENVSQLQYDSVFSKGGELDKTFKPTKYGLNDYTHEKLELPGGKNYRELVITLPRKTLDEYRAEFGHASGNAAYNAAVEAGQAYSSPHWPDPNPLAHVRFNERTDVQGAKGTHIEEVQSDWHQEGREHGYQGPAADAQTKQAFEQAQARVRNIQRQWDEYNKSQPDGRIEGDEKAVSDWYEKGHALWDEFDIAQKELTAARRAYDGVMLRVPDAPFKSSWPMLTMKRMIRWAAENGDEQITWTTGRQQGERYNKMLKDITRVERTEGGNTRVILADGKKHFLNEEQIDEVEKLLGDRAQALGPRGSKAWTTDELMLDRIYAAHEAPTKAVDLTDNPLTIGGKMHRDLYDKRIHTDLNKFVKSIDPDLKITSTEIETEPGKREQVWRLKLTPKLKKAALEGMPLSKAPSNKDTAVV